MSFLGERNAIALGVSQHLAMGGPDLLNKLSPSLLLQFAGAQTLDPRITFSRTSNATVTGPDGLIAYAPHNLLTYSEQFDNAAWAKNNCSVTANAVAAPNGEFSADYVVRASTIASVTVQRTALGFGGSQTCTASIYAKAATTGNLVGLRLQGTFPSRADVVVNLLNGVVSFSGAVNYTLVSIAVSDAGNGWYRISITATSDSTGVDRFIFGPTAAANGSWESPSATVSDLYAWGAQLNVGALQPYYTTTVKNLLGYTQEFDNAAWTKSASTVDANATTAPDGSITADKLVEDSSTGAHTVQRNPAVAGSYVFSVYAKASERIWLSLRFTGTTNSDSYFNLSTGSLGTATNCVAEILSVGNGWYRCSARLTVAASGDQAVIRLATANGTAGYTGDGTSGIFIWGAQLSDSASLDPYVYNPVAAPAAAAYYGPRFDYDPVTLAPKGLLIEEQRTNLLTYSEQFDNAVWGKTNATVTADAAVSPDGTMDGDKLVEDTTTNEHQISGAVSVTSGTSYTVSVYVKAADRTFCRFGFTGIGFSAPTRSTFNLSTGTITTNAGGSPTITAVGNGWYRLSVTNTATSTTTATFILQPMSDSTTISYLGNGVSGLFIWGAQAEAGAFPTSYIPTTTAAATRAADVAVMQGANFSNWYNQSEGTIYFDGGIPSNYSTGFPVLYSINDTTTSNNIQPAINSSADVINVEMKVSGSVVAGFYPAYTSGFTKLSFAYKFNDVNYAKDGVAGTTDTSAAIPVVSQLNIGVNQGGGNVINGHISRIAYYPRRLANAELQAITN